MGELVIVEWGDEKALANERKHGVSFQDALAVIEDPLSITFRNPDHSLEEARFLTFGHGPSGRLLVVAHTDRAGRRSADLGQACHAR